ncbi:MAG: hypothetical protein KDA87_24950 [Planctomycetales bacterium]|nr:hypothetical protein [Planctomycetales bacterium]
MSKKKVPKRKLATTRVPKLKLTVDRFELIDNAVGKLPKADLVQLVVRLARQRDDVRRELEAALSIEMPAELLISDIKSAIDRATVVNEYQLNDNFDYDSYAYEEVERGFQKLIEFGELDAVKSLALKLMDQGSYQIECSDEGLMTEEIADCIRPVIKAVVAANSDTDASAWAKQMLAADRVGFVCDRELNAVLHNN